MKLNRLIQNMYDVQSSNSMNFLFSFLCFLYRNLQPSLQIRSDAEMNSPLYTIKRNCALQRSINSIFFQTPFAEEQLETRAQKTMKIIEIE